MKIIRKTNELKNIIHSLKESNKSIGLVLTMGNIHKGHLSLIKEAQVNNEFVITTIFVNPTQFDNEDDYNSYTKTLEIGDPEIGLDNGQGGVYAPGDSISIVKSSVDTVEKAQDAVARLDFALGKLDEESVKLNSKAQRFEFTTSHLTSMVGVLEESVDTIEDFDEAREMSRLAQAQIRQQSAIAMMVQAQQLSQTIHQLLNQ